MSNERFDFDVVVAGYGPTGQATASLLARQGHKVCVFEKFPTLYGQPRLCTVDGETARIIQASGDVDRAFRVSSWCRKYELEDTDGELITAMDWSDLHICGYPGRISFYQPDVEETMDATARERGVEVNQGWEVVSFEDDADGITVTARQRDMGYGSREIGERTVRARYLVGADGAKSAVREAAGITRQDFGFRDAFLSVDCERIGEIPTKLNRGVAITICDPGRTIAFIPIGSHRMRFEFLVNPDDDHSAMLVPEIGYDFLEQAWGLTRDQVRIYRQVIYPFEGKLADQWRKGHVLLAGDAAHLMPPFLGQGACSGMRDAINLAWKLDLVLDGTSDESLLDTYELERSPHAEVLIRGSIALGEVACERDPVKAAARDEAFRTGQVPPPPDDPTLLDGVLHRGEDGELGPYVGDLIEQGIVRRDGEVGRFDDIVGWGFHLLGYEFDPLEKLDDEQRGFLEQIGCHAVMITNDPDAGGILDLDRTYEAFSKDREMIEAILVRPDFSIFGVGWSADDVPALVDELRERLQLTADADVTAAVS
ncbi:MAG TPA: bifunctional 3-(3-hydroxy-phenyl)propionate/3-hydroxycinnamic acid hydroxylase [Baekduia sp.]|jgi:3-(3-hydroxy-phenyl)propionate hydroxylase